MPVLFSCLRDEKRWEICHRNPQWHWSWNWAWKHRIYLPRTFLVLTIKYAFDESSSRQAEKEHEGQEKQIRSVMIAENALSAVWEEKPAAQTMKPELSSKECVDVSDEKSDWTEHDIDQGETRRYPECMLKFLQGFKKHVPLTPCTPDDSFVKKALIGAERELWWAAVSKSLNSEADEVLGCRSMPSQRTSST